MKHQKEQLNIFTEDKRLAKALESKPYLVFFKEKIDWEMFRPRLKEIYRPKEPKNNRGAKPYDEVFMFKVLILGEIHGNIPPEKLEGAINGDSTYQYFLDISETGSIPDEKTIRNYRDALDNRFKEIFKLFNAEIEREGYFLKSGKIVDASIVEVPKQRNTKEENKEIKEGKIPESWTEKKKCHKDTDARWKTKGKQRYFGYENHIKIDEKPKLIEEYSITDASVHDSQETFNLIRKEDKGKEMYGDSAFRSEETEKRLRGMGIKSQIHERAYKNKPLTEEQKALNKEKSKIRARVEHVFAWMEQTTGMFIRTIGRKRAETRIGFMNLMYNMKRYIFLKRTNWMGIAVGQICLETEKKIRNEEKTRL